jgi:hypothetical protein
MVSVVIRVVALEAVENDADGEENTASSMNANANSR